MDNLTDVYIDSIALIEKKNIIGKLFNMEITERGVQEFYHVSIFIIIIIVVLYLLLCFIYDLGFKKTIE
jgi:hypothetical protein